MRDLHQRLPLSNWLLLLCALVSVICLAQFHHLGPPYSDPVANLVLQLTVDPAVFTQALQKWNLQPAALANYQFWDTLFPAAYALGLALLVGLLSQLHREAGAQALGRAGAILSLALPACAVFDWMENALLTQALAGETSAAGYYLESGQHFSAQPKYFLLSIAFAWLIFAFFGLLRGRRSGS